MPVKNTSFSQTLANLQRGDTIEQLDELLTEALQASNDTGKVSKVTVTLTIKPNGTVVPTKFRTILSRLFLSLIKNQLFYLQMAINSLCVKTRANRN